MLSATCTTVSWFCRRILESVHITPHVIYAVLTQEALNPFIEWLVWPPHCRVSFDNFQTRPEARDPAYLISPGLSELVESLPDHRA